MTSHFSGLTRKNNLKLPESPCNFRVYFINIIFDLISFPRTKKILSFPKEQLLQIWKEMVERNKDTSSSAIL